VNASADRSTSRRRERERKRRRAAARQFKMWGEFTKMGLALGAVLAVWVLPALIAHAAVRRGRNGACVLLALPSTVSNVGVSPAARPRKRGFMMGLTKTSDEIAVFGFGDYAAERDHVLAVAHFFCASLA
jgi:hypothetical protein